MIKFADFGGRFEAGFRRENDVRAIEIDCTDELQPGWGAGLIIRRPRDTADYEAPSELEDGILRYTFTSTDLWNAGSGWIMPVIRGPGGEVKKTATAQLYVSEALSTGGDPPEPPEQYRTAAQQDVIDAGKLSKAAQDAKTADMTQPVGLDADGKLWALPGGGGGGQDVGLSVVNGLINVTYEEANE